MLSIPSRNPAGNPAEEAAADAGLEIAGVTKRFGSVTALHSTSLSVPAGRICSLLGPSGCGKTTTLRLVAGFMLPDSGRIRIQGVDRTYDPPQRRKLGMVFQSYGLFPHMTVAENVAFGLKMARLARAEIERRTRRMLDIVHLPQHADRFPHQLSGGQQQRVALARSLVTEPSVLLLDEPLGALDKNLRESMQFEIRQLQRQVGITTLLVTHDQEEALTMSDLVVVMDKGRILQTGDPVEIYERPDSRFVAEFLGTSNIFHCTVEGIDGPSGLRLGLPFGGSHLSFTASTRLRPAVGSTVLAAVRPEHVVLTPLEPGAGADLPATVVSHVFKGTTHVFQVALDGVAGPVVCYRQVTGPAAETVLPPGARVGLSWAPGAIRVLSDGLAS
ncbi:ABC transporter ATP-binding protein [Azospirillum endophyticum]